MRDILEENAAARAANAIAPDDLMVVGGEKFDLSKPEPFDPEKPDENKRPPRYVFDGKNIYDLETPLSEELKPVEMRDTVVIDNRALTVGDFGDDGRSALVELYEGFLKAHQRDIRTVLCTADNSDMILELIRSEGTKKRIKGRFATNGQFVKYINWGDPTVTFEDFLHVSAAGCRWKIQWELKDRLMRGGDISSLDVAKISKSITEITLIAIEKYLALPERDRLIGV